MVQLPDLLYSPRSVATHGPRPGLVWNRVLDLQGLVKERVSLGVLKSLVSTILTLLVSELCKKLLTQ